MKGRLKLAKNGKTWLLEREDGIELQAPQAQLTRSLTALDPQKHDGLEVEFEIEGGAKRIREVGAQWEPPVSQANASNRYPQRDRRAQGGGGGRQRSGSGFSQTNRGHFREKREENTVINREFHNPYNFIPAPPRKTSNTDLDDGPPAGHDRYLDEHWSGRIRVKLTTKSPLLILDAAKSKHDDNDHKTFPTRIVDGKPYLPPTSIKGMLRSAYEAATNSRMAVFHKHGAMLAYRMPAQKTDKETGPFPARVVYHDERLSLRIMKTEAAARLRRYQLKRDLPRGQKIPRDKGQSKAALRYISDGLPRHGDSVWARVEKNTVTEIERGSAERPSSEWKQGWACVTGPNINGKRYERVFIEGDDDLFIEITKQHKKLWNDLVGNYQETHIRDLEKRKKRKEKPQDYLGDEPGKTGWSRHIHEKGAEKLEERTLCYVELDSNGLDTVKAILPVTISRRLFNISPDELLCDSLKPATTIDELSPADRVFGWVNQNGKGAYKGNLRIGPVRCQSPDPLDDFGEQGFPLAILGQPKPQQSRFYVAQSRKGEAQPDGISSEKAGYASGKGLRGRKVYPHHASMPDKYWDDPTEDRTQKNVGGRFQEYRRPHEATRVTRGGAWLNNERTAFELNKNKEQRDDQNRSITGWVKPHTIFEFDIDITNLSEVELGALIWLLDLNRFERRDGDESSPLYHRLGGGKPLGFGSVRLEVVWEYTDLRLGKDWRKTYLNFDEISKPDQASAMDRVGRFKKAVADAYPSAGFESVSFIRAFLCCVEGFKDGKPIHYPRTRPENMRDDVPVPPNPEGKSFEWFVENDRVGGQKVALPALDGEEKKQGLPILIFKQR